MALVLPFLPLYLRALGIEDDAAVQRWSGAIFSAPFLCAALMTPLWGWLGDRVGRKPMVVRALLGLSVSLLLMSFARSAPELLLLRCLQGLISGFIPAAIALVSATAPRAQQGTALGVLSSSQAAGIVVGPLLGGVLADPLGYRGLFLVTSAIQLLAAATVVLLVRESRAPRARDGQATVRDNIRSSMVPPFPIILSCLLITQMALLMVQPFFALFVEDLGVAPDRLSSTTGLLFGVTGLTMFAAAPFWGRLSDRAGRRRTLTIAFFGGAALFALQSVSQSVTEVLLWRLLQGVCAAGMLPALYAFIAHFSAEERRGGIMGIASSVTMLGGVVGPILGGWLASTIDMRPVFAIAGALLLVNVVQARRLPQDHRPRIARARRSWELPTQ
jgi:DHA1 family multidrug resistance protein-like MFS transporter